MKLGIVGLPNVGKSTLFNAITNQKAEAKNYPFCTIDPNVGLVEVPDKRIDNLTKLYSSKKTIHAAIEFYDIAGLVKGASKGEGLGNKFLSNIREVDAIVHVVRAFEDENVTHVDGQLNPQRDIQTINEELILSDLEMLENIYAKREKALKGDRKLKPEVELLKRILDSLSEGISARELEYSTEDKEILKQYQLLTIKPVIYVANVDGESVNEENEYSKQIEEIAEKENSSMVQISAQLEQEISELEDKDEKEEFLHMMGIEESGLEKLIKSSYDLLGLMSFITTGEDETRAWTINKGTTALEAAGKIHTDIQRGFIRAEIVNYNDLINLGSMNALKEKGLVRLEGKEYIMQDGDVVHFRFNV